MNDKKTTYFYSFLCIAVFLLFCLWYFTSAQKGAQYLTAKEPNEALPEEYEQTSEALSQTDKTEKEVSEGLININTARAEELSSLPGIGEKTAELIIAYRKEKGGFASKEEIMNIAGIGEKTYKSLQNLICIE